MSEIKVHCILIHLAIYNVRQYTMDLYFACPIFDFLYCQAIYNGPLFRLSHFRFLGSNAVKHLARLPESMIPKCLDQCPADRRSRQ
jgi:hypothetical protein